MFEDVMHQGKELKEWQELFKHEFSLGELYRMAKEDVDFSRFLLRFNDVISKD